MEILFAFLLELGVSHECGTMIMSLRKFDNQFRTKKYGKRDLFVVLRVGDEQTS